MSKGFSTEKSSKVIKPVESIPVRGFSLNPLANFAPMLNDLPVTRKPKIIEVEERPRKNRKSVTRTTTTSTLATTTVPGTVPNSDFKDC